MRVRVGARDPSMTPPVPQSAEPNRERLAIGCQPAAHPARGASYVMAVSMLVALACSGGGSPTTTPTPATSPATAARPIPYPVPEPPAFRRAVERGTRTRTGEPGPRYWTQFARYALRAELDPGRKRL